MATQVAPSKAIISSVGGVGNGGSENSTKPSIIGTAGANVTVNIYDGVRLLGTAIASSTGAWTFTPAADIKLGKHSFTAIAVSSTGTYGVSSEPVSVTVGSAAPAKPVVSGLTDDTGHAIGSPTNDPRPNMSGTGTPTDVITMYDGSTPIASTTVNPDGTWSLKPTSDLPSGTNDIYVIETPAGGGTGTPSDHYPVIIDTHVPATPAALVLKDDSGATIAAGSTSPDAHPNFSGTGTAGDIIKVYDGSNVIGSVKIGPDGTWSFKPTTDLSNGTHDLYVTETTTAGTASAASPHTAITVNTSVPSTPAAPVAKDDSNNVIPAGSTTADAHPTLSGTGTANDIIKVYDGANLIGSVSIGSDGKWSFKPSTDLSTGVTHNISVTESNSVGTASAHSPNLSLFVDTHVPATPTVSGITDSTGHTVPAGSTTVDPRPSMSGTGATPGDTITLYDGPTAVGTTTVNSDGTWSVKPSSDLPDTAHDLYVIDTSVAGVPSSPSAHTTIDTNSYVPGKPVVSGLYDDSGHAIPAGGATTATEPTMSGTGKTGDIVTLYDAGTVIGSVKITNADGSWVIAPSKDLSSGQHDLYVIESTTAGIVSPQSDHFSAVVTVPPSGLAIVDLWAVNPDIDTGRWLGIYASSGSVTQATSFKVDVKGAANSTITLYDGKTVMGTTTTDSTGTGSLVVSGLASGAHDLSLTQTVNSVVSSHSPNFTITTLAPSNVPTVTGLQTSDGGAILPDGSHIVQANGLFVMTVGPKGSIVNLYDNNNLIMSKPADSVDGGGTKFTILVAMAPTGVHHYTATTTINGVESAHSNAVNVTLDSYVQPAPPADIHITQVFQINSDQTQLRWSGDYNSGDTTTGTKFTLYGVAPSGYVVVLFDGSTVIGSATASGSGAWSLTATNLSVGLHDFTVAQALPGGGYGTHSTDFFLTTVAASSVPIISAVATVSTGAIVSNGGLLPVNNSNYVVVLAPVGSVINVYDGSTLLGTSGASSVAGDGTRINLPAALSSGVHYLTATTVIAGVESAHSATFSLTLTGGSLQSTLHSVASDVADDQSQASSVVDSTSQVEHHTAVGEQDTFKGSSTYAHETVDLNVDPATYFKQDTAHIEGAKGVSIDTLHLTGDHQVLDLTSLTGQTAAAKISGIEVVDLGGHTNTVKLSLVDVLNLGETDLFQTDGKQQMMVKGSAGDSVDLSNSHIAGLAEGEWQAHGTTQVGGVTYNVYEHSGVHTELLVQQGVQIVVH